MHSTGVAEINYSSGCMTVSGHIELYMKMDCVSRPLIIFKEQAYNMIYGVILSVESILMVQVHI